MPFKQHAQTIVAAIVRPSLGLLSALVLENLSGPSESRYCIHPSASIWTGPGLTHTGKRIIAPLRPFSQRYLDGTTMGRGARDDDSQTQFIYCSHVAAFHANKQTSRSLPPLVVPT